MCVCARPMDTGAAGAADPMDALVNPQAPNPVGPELCRNSQILSAHSVTLNL